MSTAEMLLALRAPNSGWLAAVLCALDEAMQDPGFDARQRAVLRELLDRPSMPNAVALAAHETLCEFEQATHPLYFQADRELAAMPARQRPKLTLCVSNH